MAIFEFIVLFDDAETISTRSSPASVFVVRAFFASTLERFVGFAEDGLLLGFSELMAFFF